MYSAVSGGGKKSGFKRLTSMKNKKSNKEAKDKEGSQQSLSSKFRN